MTTCTYIAAGWGAAAIGSVVATALVLGGRGTFEYRVLATGIAIAGLALLVLAFALHLVARRSGFRRLRSIARYTALLGVVGLSQLEARVAGAFVHGRDVRAAQAFCERVVARLREHHATTRRYPLALEDVVRGLADPPYLFARGSVFTSSGDEFMLSFSEDDAVIPHVVQYSSTTWQWVRF